MGQSSGIGVLDKAVSVLTAAAARPVSLADLVAGTALPRATAHRIAVALEVHGLLTRDGAGRWLPGPALGALAGSDPLLAAAPAMLQRLSDQTGESAQLYRQEGIWRVCVAAVDRASGLRDTVPVGARLPMTAGSAAQVLAAWSEDAGVPPEAVYSARTLSAVRRRGWATSVGQREPGVASVSAPVFVAGSVVAAISVSGPADRLGRRLGERLSPAILRAAAELSTAARTRPGASSR
ncbi:MAG: IclR family transcriptional regulator [Geodermatophilaceae bacterium]|nr:IclR family transcriptional regulator [Geodermatophilaceae bacterium]